ncbi:MAG TPA: FtsQ-type POTRA domain-containing protein [Clostridia bacterium]|nr:FtsQ-type POTRA domain-containing protein [Clostridia bacterium]
MARKRRIRLVRKRRLVVFRALLAIIVVSLSLFYFIQSPFWAVEAVTVRGNSFIPAGELRELAGIPLGINIFKVDFYQAEQHLLLHPLVKEVQLMRKLPREIQIVVSERTPKAVIPFNDGFYQIDGEQHVLRSVPTVSDSSLPLITGLEVGDLSPGQRLSSELLGEALALVDKLPPALRELVAEIDLSQQDTIFLHTVDGVKVNFGDSNRIDEKAALMEEILQTTLINRADLEYVDLSFAGAPVIKYAN